MKTKIYLLAIAAILINLILSSCSKDELTPPDTPDISETIKSVEFYPTKASIAEGEKQDFTFYVTYSSGRIETSLSDTEITIEDDIADLRIGQSSITACGTKEGTTVITAIYQGKTYASILNVSRKTAPDKIVFSENTTANWIDCPQYKIEKDVNQMTLFYHSPSGELTLKDGYKIIKSNPDIKMDYGDAISVNHKKDADASYPQFDFMFNKNENIAEIHLFFMDKDKNTCELTFFLSK